MALDSRLLALGVGLAVAPLVATFANAQTTPQVSFAATSAHAGKPGSPVSITLLRWSTEEERSPVVAALNPAPPPAAAPAPAAETATPAAERGGARGGRAGRAGGRGGRGGRGEATAPLTPIAALTGAIGKAPTIGYVWTDGVTGYAIKYAYHAPLPNGGERIILATNRVLGADSTQLKPDATAYEFTLIELRLNAKGLGEGKTSLTTKVIVDTEAKTIALENYAAAPVILQNVKRG